MTHSQNLKKCLGQDLENAMCDGGLIICQLHTIHVNILRYKTSHSIFRLNNRQVLYSVHIASAAIKEARLLNVSCIVLHYYQRPVVEERIYVTHS